MKFTSIDPLPSKFLMETLNINFQPNLSKTSSRHDEDGRRERTRQQQVADVPPQKKRKKKEDDKKQEREEDGKIQGDLCSLTPQLPLPIITTAWWRDFEPHLIS